MQFKGQDEVRQDAVMQQVFEMTNRLLKRDRKTNQRKLQFRTYVVIPLAQQSGIIEFVGNTSAIGDWLKPAHIRFVFRASPLTIDIARTTTFRPTSSARTLTNCRRRIGHRPRLCRCGNSRWATSSQ